MTPTTASDDGAVRDAFSRWASLQTSAPDDPELLVEHIEISHDYAGVLDTDIHGRRVVWKSVPASSRVRVTVPLTAIENVDAWNTDDVSLRERSLHIAICHSCGGDKKVRCAACGGAGKNVCGACNGARKSYGYATNGSYRLLNCTACRGKGEVDCIHCRRGVAACPTCAAEGRLQRWMEIESWQRTEAKTHPSGDEIAQDGTLVADIQRPHALTADDLAGVSDEWLNLLQPEVTHEEKITRQRLRIARIPNHRVHYRLGSMEDHVTFHGLRLRDPSPIAQQNAFDRRAARLRALRALLTVTFIVFAVASVSRGAFYRSTPTLLSIVACGAGLVAMDAAVADWTAARRRTRVRVIVAGSSLVVAIVFAVVALPRNNHARELVAAGRLDDAEAELQALKDHAEPAAWSDLHLARMRTATSDALKRQDWPRAAEAVVAARRRGVPEAALAEAESAIQNAAATAVARAERITDSRERLSQRLTAEATLMAWEQAADAWGTPPLIALRTAMARDVAAAERAARKR